MPRFSLVAMIRSVFITSLTAKSSSAVFMSSLLTAVINYHQYSIVTLIGSESYILPNFCLILFIFFFLVGSLTFTIDDGGFWALITPGSGDANMENPFQISGPPRGWFEVKRVDDGLFVRIEMPGIAKEDVEVKAQYGNLYFTGKGRKECPLETAGREYSGQIEFPNNSFREKDMKHELKNGVLRVFIPNTDKASSC